MFNSFVIRIQSLEDSVLDDVSLQLYKYFYKLIENKEKETYFTVSSFFKHKKYNLELTEGQNYLFKVSTLDIDTFSTFTSYLFKNKILQRDICIGKSKFKVKEIICDKNKSKYAYRFDNDRLNYLNSDECNISEYNLKIITPIIFKVGSQFYNDIDGEILFRHLIKKFNNYSGYIIDKKYLKDICKININIKEPMKQKISIGKNKFEGLIGNLNLNLSNLDDESLKIARILIEFSLYSGIGYKSELGFGQVVMI